MPEAKSAPLSDRHGGGHCRHGEFELVFCRDASVYDGRFANSGWLQECPDPLTKLTWDNAAVMSPATAKTLNVTTESLVTLRLDGKSLQVPVYVMPGQADGSIAIALGYGRTAAGYVGGLEDEQIAAVGVNAYPLRSSQAMYVVRGVKVERARGRYPLALTQDHHAIDTVGMKERARRVPELVREATLDEYTSSPILPSTRFITRRWNRMWEEHKYEGHRWGMSIDLSKCIGCNACVVACQAENNIPVVGKEQVLRGREMHWIRIDRYFTGRRRQAGRYCRGYAAGGLPSLRTGTVRTGLSGGGDRAQQRGAQRHGLQPLHRHAVLRQQLPLQGAAVQLLQLPQRPGRRRTAKSAR